MWLRVESSGDSCEHGDEHSGYIKGGEFLDYLSDCQLFRDSASMSLLYTLEAVTEELIYLETPRIR
jgi:hypothetical protein